MFLDLATHNTSNYKLITPKGGQTSGQKGDSVLSMFLIWNIYLSVCHASIWCYFRVH